MGFPDQPGFLSEELVRTGRDCGMRVEIAPYTPKSRHICGTTPLQLARYRALIGAIPVIAQLKGGG
jgi:hypothetical protein